MAILVFAVFCTSNSSGLGSARLVGGWKVALEIGRKVGEAGFSR